MFKKPKKILLKNFWGGKLDGCSVVDPNPVGALVSSNFTLAGGGSHHDLSKGLGLEYLLEHQDFGGDRKKKREKNGIK